MGRGPIEGHRGWLGGLILLVPVEFNFHMVGKAIEVIACDANEFLDVAGRPFLVLDVISKEGEAQIFLMFSGLMRRKSCISCMP